MFSFLLIREFQEILLVAIHFKMVYKHGEDETCYANPKKPSGSGHTSSTEADGVEITVPNRKKGDHDQPKGVKEGTHLRPRKRVGLACLHREGVDDQNEAEDRYHKLEGVKIEKIFHHERRIQPHFGQIR